MEIQGKVIKILDEQNGTGRNGAWRKREYVIETGDQYPRKLCFNLWGDKIDQYPVHVNDSIKLFFDVESREYNGRWYTDVKGWKIENLTSSSNDAGQDVEFQSEMASSGNDAPPPLTEDDLPF